MTQLINKDTAPEAISDKQVTVEGEIYRFEKIDGQFYVRSIDPVSGQQTQQFRLVMITGSHHMHVFWYDLGIEKTPGMLPITYLIDQKRWIHRRSAFLRAPELPYRPENGRWNRVCCQCHSTHPRQHIGEDPNAKTSNNWNTQVGEFGIACEACHGPGQEHVKFHEQDRSSKEIGRIVDPMQLSVDQQRDVCARCHSVGFVDMKAVGRENYHKHGQSFRPGDLISECSDYCVVQGSPSHLKSETFRKWFTTVRPNPNNYFWPDGQVRVSGRAYNGMLESKCAQDSDLTCLTCHTMHQSNVEIQDLWRDDQLRPGMRDDGACLMCHQEYKELGSKHTHHPADSSGSRCMNCHMPHTVYGMLKTIRSHTISSPSVKSAIETTRPTACNLCHLDHTLAETAKHLSDWYGKDVPDLTDEEQTISLAVLQLLKGDAAQRVLQITAMERPEAQNASGTNWIVVYALVGMLDRYSAIRLIAERLYSSLPDAPPLDFNYATPPEQRASLISKRLKQIQDMHSLQTNPALLIDEEGRIDHKRLNSLLKSQNNRPVFLQE